MADDDPLFNLDVVRDFILANGGKVKNHQLVTHFKTFLNDPRRKVVNREKFKTFVNTLSSVKLDASGEKVLVLKKKFRDNAEVTNTSASQAAHMPKLSAPKQKLQDSFQVRDSSPSPPPTTETNNNSVAGAEAMQDPIDVSELAAEEVIAGAPASAERISPREASEEFQEDPETGEEKSLLEQIQETMAKGGGGASQVEEVETIEKVPVVVEEEPKMEEVKEVEIVEEVEVEPPAAAAPVAPAPAPVPSAPMPPPPPPSDPTPPSVDVPDAKEPVPMDTREDPSVGNSAPGSTADSSREASVNRDIENEPLNQSTVSVREFTKQFNKAASQSELSAVPPGVKRSPKHEKDGREDDHENITLDATEREWMVTSSGADYQKIHKLLNKHPRLATRKDFITTALHWAAKHGNVDVVKLLCADKSVEVNARSNGYTALHLAAMQGHELVIEILVQTYNADPNLRDHSGRKPKQYLKNSASTRAQRGSGGPLPFRRVGSYSSKIRSAGHFGIHASVAVRNSWVGGPDMVPGERSTSPSPHASPGSVRRASAPVTQGDAAALMPPPQGVPVRRIRSKSRRDSNKENHSDSETPRSRSQSPRTLASSSDPNLAATYQQQPPPASMYQSAV